MRTSSGFAASGDGDVRSEEYMSEDRLSTEARWGTPHTSSFSTADSQRQSLSPVTETTPIGPTQSQQQAPAQNSGHEVPAENSLQAFPYVHSTGSQPHTDRSYYANPIPYRYYRPIQPRPQPHSDNGQASISPSQQPEALRRYSIMGTDPWNPASPTGEVANPESLKRRFSDVDAMADFKLDREYPDLMEEELDELEKTGEGKGDGKGKEARKGRKRPRRGKGKGDEAKGPKGGNENDTSGGNGRGIAC